MESISSEELTSALRRPQAYPHDVAGDVIVHETHISWVFLAGEFVYKVKKPVVTNFLDYSTLEARRQLCCEEVRLDKRYAPELYLGVSTITIDHGAVSVEGGGEIVEFAVKMRRFPEDALLSDRLRTGKLSTHEVRQLSESIAHFHREAAKADPDRGWGRPDDVRRSAQDNLDYLASSGVVEASDERLPSLNRWTASFFEQHRMMFSQRVAAGFIRECHGDLHLDNVIHWQGRLSPFDGIEFNDEFRWIDVMSDAAFLAMDFAARGHADLSRSFISGYLEQTGDHASLPLLRWYLVYRAMVRAKVAAIRAEQCTSRASDHAEAIADCHSHIDLADRFSQQTAPCLWITHGVSGSGKSRGSELVVQRTGALRLRSDIERKRQFGLSPTDRPDRAMREKVYSGESAQATYGRLFQLARGIVQAGYSVIVDATFIRREHRARFRQLAVDLGIGFAILDFDTDQQTLRQRIAQRAAKNDDASDADQAVLELQLASRQPLSASELRCVVSIPETVAEVNAL